MVVVDSGLAAVEVGWGDPFGAAVFAFSGSPAAGFDQSVVRAAGQGFLVDPLRVTTRSTKSAKSFTFAVTWTLADLVGRAYLGLDGCL